MKETEGRRLTRGPSALVPALVGISALVAHWAASLSYSNLSWGFNHYFFLGGGLPRQ